MESEGEKQKTKCRESPDGGEGEGTKEWEKKGATLDSGMMVRTGLGNNSDEGNRRVGRLRHEKV